MTERCIVFLGNPGQEYEKTRHNIGSMLSNQLEFELGITIQWSVKFNGLVGSIDVEHMKIIVFKPQIFMNLCGSAIRKLCDFHKLSAVNLIVIHDDLELNFGEIAYKVNGGAGGHNGLRSIDTHLGSSEYLRCRIGIGRPIHGDIANFVLSRFTKEEEISLPLILETASKSLSNILRGSTQPTGKLRVIPDFKKGRK